MSRKDRKRIHACKGCRFWTPEGDGHAWGECTLRGRTWYSFVCVTYQEPDKSQHDERRQR